MRTKKYIFIVWYHNRNSLVDIHFEAKTFYDFNRMKEYSAKHAEKYKKYAKKNEEYYSTYYPIDKLF